MPTWSRLYQALQAAGIAVYAPGQHPAVCKAPYVVLAEGTTAPIPDTRKLGTTVFSVYVFVPIDRYSSLEAEKQRVRVALQTVSGLHKTGLETPAIIEDEYKAHSSLIEYRTQRRF